MAFQTKRFVSIIASMVNRMRVGSMRLTDYSVGAVNRVMLEAPAQEIDELYQQMVNAIVEAVPVSVYRSFSFPLLPAAAAGGQVRVQITPQASALVIRAGQLLTATATAAKYAAILDTLIPPGASFGDVPVKAVVPGLAGNIPAGTGFTFDQPPAGFLSASNLVGMIDGRDQETEDERLIRFNHYVETLARGTVAANFYGAKDKSFLVDANGAVTERVAFVQIYEPWVDDHLQPVGLFQVFIHNGTGGTSPALVARTSAILKGYRLPDGTRVAGYKAAGVQCDVFAATETPVPITGAITTLPTVDRDSTILAATQAIAAYVAGLDIGETSVAGRIEQIVMDLPGVYNFKLAAGTDDVTAGTGIKLVPGAIVIPA